MPFFYFWGMKEYITGSNALYGLAIFVGLYLGTLCIKKMKMILVRTYIPKK